MESFQKYTEMSQEKLTTSHILEKMVKYFSKSIYEGSI